MSGAALWVGPAGWSYDDWEGIVYPPGLGPRRLETVAGLFRLIEINATFYRSPAPAVATRWVERVRERPGFRFTVKLVRLFTHEDPRHWTVRGRDEFRDGIEPLREAGLLGAVLVQFPWFFQATEASVVRLGRIRKAFPEHPLVLEVRHRTWLDDRRLEEISSLGYSFCNADQPQARDSLPLADVVTGPQAYLRLHGRNASTWFDRKAAVHEKYDYLYGAQELAQLLAVAERLRGRAEELYVVANNHYLGQGPANALEMFHALTGERPVIPDTLVARYPRLAEIRRPESAAGGTDEGSVGGIEAGGEEA